MESETHVKHIKYVGPFDAISIPDLGVEDVKPGDVFEVADAAAGRAPFVELVDDQEVENPGEGLLAQVDNFVEAPKPRKPREA